MTITALTRCLRLSGLASGLLLSALPALAADTPAPTAAAACPALLNKTFPRLQDEKPQSLCQYSGQVVLVVNTASYCGFAPQFKGLEALYAKYKDRGLVVLGFPSHDFGGQEAATAKETAEFCANTFGVKFPMFAKSHVSGSEANALFVDLVKASGTRPKWNFYKYLIARDGRTVEAYSSVTTPEGMVQDIEKALAAQK
jgi:glutathione peroxidase